MSSVSDPIADLMTRIRNGMTAKSRYVDVERSKFKKEILHLLKRCGYIDDVIEKDLNGDGRGMMRIFLKYGEGRISVINGIDRISTPGKRKYVVGDEIPLVRGGMGIAIVSTSKGVMTGREARKLNIGGELVGSVW